MGLHRQAVCSHLSALDTVATARAPPPSPAVLELKRVSWTYIEPVYTCNIAPPYFPAALPENTLSATVSVAFSATSPPPKEA